jgi:iron complex transport system substrate-binding protein
MRGQSHLTSFLVLVLSAGFVAQACAQSNAGAAASRVMTDATGRQVEIKDTSRIVTIGGAVTEIVFALGYGDRVIGVDLTSSFPPAARGKPNIGYMRALSAEGVISLAPTLVLAIEGSGPSEVVRILANAAIPFLIVPEGHDEAGVLRKVRFVAAALGERVRGEAVARTIAEDFAALRAVRDRVEKHRKAVFVLAMGSGAPTVGGANTGAEGIFALAGVDNAMSGFSGYKPAVAESTLEAAPDVIVTMAERDHGLGPDEMFSLPAFKGTPAARDRRLVPIPSYFLTFGPRTPQAAHDLAAAVYPELKLPALPERPWTLPAAAAAK